MTKNNQSKGRRDNTNGKQQVHDHEQQPQKHNKRCNNYKNGDIGCENVLNWKKTKVVKPLSQANVVHEDKEKEKYVKIDDGK